MIVTQKNAAYQNDVVIRTGKFPTQGTKVVVSKGDTKISFSIDDIPDAVQALTSIALNIDPNVVSLNETDCDF